LQPEDVISDKPTEEVQIPDTEPDIHPEERDTVRIFRLKPDSDRKTETSEMISKEDLSSEDEPLITIKRFTSWAMIFSMKLFLSMKEIISSENVESELPKRSTIRTRKRLRLLRSGYLIGKILRPRLIFC
jgi:hypothetical protein